MSFAQRLLELYRATGADPPLGDPRRAHGVTMEGYYWRCETSGGEVVIALCGVCRDTTGSWAVTAVAAHPGGRAQPPGLLVDQIHAPVCPDRRRLGIDGGRVIQASADGVSIDVQAAAGQARLRLSLERPVGWPRRLWGGLGPAHWLPALGQYWHPHVLGGRGAGELVIGDRRIDLTGARVYAEKNWGTAFPQTWWWGQAGGLGGEDAMVAFAGGGLGGGLSATAVVIRVGGEVLRFGAPTAVVRARADRTHWLIRARSARHRLTVEGRALEEAVRLPVPIPAERRVAPRAHQHLAASVRVDLRRSGRQVFAGETALGGLEFGA